MSARKPKKPIRNTVLAALFVTSLIAFVFAMWGLSDFEQPTQHTTTHSIPFNDTLIAGTLSLPDGCNAPAVAIFVHGDGPQNRFHNDGYLPLMNALLDNCIGVYSWDKPGVGDSTGNWLKQSMTNRAELANTALLYLQALPALSNNRIGYLGFSQAGWVVPKAASMTRPAFSVLIGAAINWQEQGAYLTRTRLELGGVDKDNVSIIAEQIRKSDESLFNSAEQKNTADIPVDIDPGRFEFISLNYHADARRDLSTMPGPVMALWGADDVNVNAAKNAQQYQQLLKPNDANKIVIIPNATHSLLKTRWFNYQTYDQWPVTSQILIATMGRRAYAPDVIESIADWINNSTGSH